MCRPEQINVLRSYKALHAKGLEVIGISLDDRVSTAALKHYVHEKGYPWRQIHDTRGWDSPLAAPYQLSSLPFLVLIGSDGKIAALNPQGASLQPAVLHALSLKEGLPKATAASSGVRVSALPAVSRIAPTP